MAKTKDFVVSTADFALYLDDILACTGTTNLDTSIEVTMDEQEVRGGKGNQLLYSFKYNRQLEVTLESAEWRLEYVAMQVGTTIGQGASDVYHIAECVDIVDGIGTLKDTPVGDVGVELESGDIVTLKADGTMIDVSEYLTNGTVQATYQYNRNAKVLTIDADSTPYVGRLVLDADKHNNKVGKVGSVQIVIPSYQLNGEFTISFTPDGVTSTNMDGKALAVQGDSCSEGSAVYAYIYEFDDTDTTSSVIDIAATPSDMNLVVGDTKTISVIGLKGTLYSSIQIDNEDCIFTSDDTDVATVDEDGVVTAIGAGETIVHISYGEYTDIIQVRVTE